MGKSNRIRVHRANETVKAPGAKNKKKGMPSWLMTLITIVVAVAVLASVALGLLASNGVPNRLRTSMKSENYRINTNQMSYYFYSTYESFLEEYESYLSYFSLDTSKSLKSQPFGGSDTSKTYYDTYFLGKFEGSWFDYFAAQTKAEVTSMLLYLEEADSRNIVLTEEELNQIDASLDSMTQSMAIYYSSPSAYLSDVYGKGVSKSDVRKAMQYSTLANKAYNAVVSELDGQITDDLIQSTYDGNKKDFDVVDYTYYSFKVDYEEIAEETLGSDYESLMTDNTENQNKVLEAYKAAIQKAKEDAEALSKISEAEAFKKAVLDRVAADAYDDLYADNSADSKKGDMSAEDVAAIRSAMIAEVLANALSDETAEENKSIVVEDGAETGTAYGKTVSAAYAEVLQKVKDSLETKVDSALTSYIQDKATYTKDDNFSEWAFADGRTANETTVLTDGDGADAEINTEDGYTHVSVYLLRTLPHPDTDKTKNVAYALFSSEAAAEAAIKALGEKGSFDLSAFEAVADDCGSTGHTAQENCYEGYLGSTTLDGWLFDDKLAVGDYTKSPLKLEDSVWAVAYYTGEGELTWKVTVKSSVLSEKFEAYYSNMETQYAITVKEKSFKKIDA